MGPFFFLSNMPTDGPPSTAVRSNSSTLPNSFTATEEIQYDPSGRYQKSTTHIEQSRGIRHVYKAFDTETALEVAWQEYWGVSVSSMNAIEKSIETLKSLNHKHIIKYHEGWVDRKQKKVIFITEAMPTGRGSITNVRRFLSRNVKMKSSVLRKWLGQILLGLEFLHSCELPWIHRDLRCENIYIRSNVGLLKIGGLELGIFMQATHPAEFDGTPGYMPPELASNHFDEKSDVYAFGMCVLEMFTFKYPYGECATSYQIFAKQLRNEKPDSMQTIEDPVVVDLISQCLAPLSQRPTSKKLLQHSFFSDDLEEDASKSGDHPLATEVKVEVPAAGEGPEPIAPDSTKDVEQPMRESFQSHLVDALKDNCFSTETSTTNSLERELPVAAVLSGDSSIKCFSENLCVRYYYRDITSIQELRKMLAEDLEKEEKSLKLYYTDHDQDTVMITKRTTIMELVEFAKSVTVNLVKQ